jgi:hypothetical protein
MSAGKYSPTIRNMGNFDARCANPGDIYDREGYSRYGYNINGIDRVGKTEDEYFYESTFGESIPSYNTDYDE